MNYASDIDSTLPEYLPAMMTVHRRALYKSPTISHRKPKSLFSAPRLTFSLNRHEELPCLVDSLGRLCVCRSRKKILSGALRCQGSPFWTWLQSQRPSAQQVSLDEVGPSSTISRSSKGCRRLFARPIRLDGVEAIGFASAVPRSSSCGRRLFAVAILRISVKIQSSSSLVEYKIKLCRIIFNYSLSLLAQYNLVSRIPQSTYLWILYIYVWIVHIVLLFGDIKQVYSVAAVQT